MNVVWNLRMYDIDLGWTMVPRLYADRAKALEALGTEEAVWVEDMNPGHSPMFKCRLDGEANGPGDFTITHWLAKDAWQTAIGIFTIEQTEVL